MNKSKFYLILLASFLLACSDDSPETEALPEVSLAEVSSETELLPNEPFMNRTDYVLSDFSLSGNYVYWEIRRGSLSSEEKDETLYSYDSETYSTLDETNLNNLSQADSEYGFAAQCLPGYCPVYGVTILDGNTNTLTSKSELLEFFGKVDTEAELNLWLWANDYYVDLFSKDESGYYVIVSWDSLCGRRGKDLVFVDENGVITEQRTISTEEYHGCV